MLDRLPLFALSFICVVVLATLAMPIINQDVPLLGDLGLYHLPLRAFYADCLHSGDSFLWWPALGCGHPIHGDGQGGFYHPLHYFLYRFLPLLTAFNLEAWLPYPFALIGTLLWLRRCGFPTVAALAGAATFAFGNVMMAHYVHVNGISVLSHTPWLLWLATAAYRDERPAPALLGVSWLFASQWLLGYPQYVWLSLLTCAWWGLYLLNGERRWGRAALLLLSLATGLLLAGVQFAPSMETLRLSARTRTDLAFRGSFSLHPVDLFGAFAPHLFDHDFPACERNVLANEMGCYAGVLPLFGLAWMVKRESDSFTRLGRWAIWLMGLATVLALGEHSPLFRLYVKIPVLGVFRCPCRYMAIAQLAAAVLAALAVADFATKPPRWPLLAVPIVSSLAVAAILALNNGQPRFPALRQPFTTSCPVFGVMMLAGVGFLFGRSRAILSVALIVAVADLAFTGLPTLTIYGRDTWEPFLARQFVPPEPTSGRLLIHIDHGNATVLRGCRLTSAYLGIDPARKLDRAALNVLRVTGTTWVLGDTWQKVPNPLPELRLVCQANTMTDVPRDLADIDIDRVAVVNQAIELDAGTPGAVTVAERRPGRLRVQTETAGRQLLVFAENDHPGWQATVNGQRVEIVRTYGDLIGVVVPAGTADVQLKYNPFSQKIGWGMTFAGAVLTLGQFWAVSRSRRLANQEAL